MGEPSWGPVGGGERIAGLPTPTCPWAKAPPEAAGTPSQALCGWPSAQNQGHIVLGPSGQDSGPSEAASSSPSLPTSNGSINVEHQVLLQVPFSEFNASYDTAVRKIRTLLQSKEDVCTSKSKGEGALVGLAPPRQPWGAR